jgi:hypothetical protein
MKQKDKMIFMITAVILSLCFLLIRGNAAVPAQLMVTPSLFDAGTVAEGQVITGAATIENRGTQAVQITNVRTN